MIRWLKLPAAERTEILGLVSNRTGLLAYAIEKDWWVTLALYAIFKTQWRDNIVFKGGTSLSKSWGLIERFSEDIDLAIDRSVLGFSDELSKNKVKELRKASCDFTSGPFRDSLEKELLTIGIPSYMFELKVLDTTESDRDPQIIELYYLSSLKKETYIKEAVLIEIGARSLREPSEQRIPNSIISETLGNKTAGEPFSILTVNPARTFLEKIFLLHEEFCKPIEKIRTERLSRHLYDIEKIMDTKYGELAMQDTKLYYSIVNHRSNLNIVRGVNYANHGTKSISFIPPLQVMNQWEDDYKAMQNNMIYGDSKPFNKVIERMHQLQTRFRNLEA